MEVTKWEAFDWRLYGHPWYGNVRGGKMEIMSTQPYRLVFTSPENSNVQGAIMVQAANPRPANHIVDSQTNVWRPTLPERFVEIDSNVHKAAVHRHSNAVLKRMSHGFYDYLQIDGFTTPECGCDIHAPWGTCFGGPPPGGSILMVAKNPSRYELVKGLGLVMQGRSQIIVSPETGNFFLSANAKYPQRYKIAATDDSNADDALGFALCLLSEEEDLRVKIFGYLTGEYEDASNVYI